MKTKNNLKKSLKIPNNSLPGQKKKHLLVRQDLPAGLGRFSTKPTWKKSNERQVCNRNAIAMNIILEAEELDGISGDHLFHLLITFRYSQSYWGSVQPPLIAGDVLIWGLQKATDFHWSLYCLTKRFLYKYFNYFPAKTVPGGPGTFLLHPGHEFFSASDAAFGKGWMKLTGMDESHSALTVWGIKWFFMGLSNISPSRHFPAAFQHICSCRAMSVRGCAEGCVHLKFKVWNAQGPSSHSQSELTPPSL